MSVVRMLSSQMSVGLITCQNEYLHHGLGEGYYRVTGGLSIVDLNLLRPVFD